MYICANKIVKETTLKEIEKIGEEQNDVCRKMNGDKGEQRREQK